MPTIFATPHDLLKNQGSKLACTDWFEIDQERINLFADATEDHQWIHVDPEKAATGPFGSCIAHGYLTLSLVNYFLPQLIDVQGIKMGVNVGLDRVRFPSPVPVGSKIRAQGEIVEVEELKCGIQSIVRVTVEIEGQDKPACVADTISRYFPAD